MTRWGLLTRRSRHAHPRAVARDWYLAEAAAVHESGHFVVGLELGLSPMSARTDGRGSGTTKFRKLPDDLDLRSREGAARVVAMTLAGGLAEYIAFGTPVRQARSPTSDHARATMVLMGLPTQAERIEVQSEAISSACRILHRRWADVTLIAEQIRDGARAWGASA